MLISTLEIRMSERDICRIRIFSETARGKQRHGGQISPLAIVLTGIVKPETSKSEVMYGQ